MRVRTRVIWLALAVAAALSATPEAQRSLSPTDVRLRSNRIASNFGVARHAAQRANAAPKLAVLIVVDQMRADYVDRFRDQWTSGLKRLLTRGAWFSNAAYPYLSTVTCAGHATISTGTFPHRHGVRHNTWFDRAEGRVVTCTEDGASKAISYGAQSVADGDSAVRLRVPGYADEMRAQRGARVVSLSLKARSAIMMAGHGGDAVTWLSESLHVWQTSSAFGSAVPEVKAFVEANPIDADYGKTWDRLLPLPQYQFPDDLVGETPPRGWTPVFPHVLSSATGKPDEIFYAQWERSPFANAFLGRFATALVESFQLGQRDTTDVLAVSFSSPDLAGHVFGPRSQEVQDMYARLDVTIGTLLDRLDAVVGAGGYMVALTADHGVTDIPEQLKDSGKDAGRLSARALADFIEGHAQAAAGPGRYVAAISGNDIHFEPGMYDKLEARPAAFARMIRQVAAQPGIARVFRRHELVGGARARSEQLRAVALGYVSGQSGELVFALEPGWMFSTTGTTHGSLNPDDQRVPIILLGQRFKPGQYREAATPADIAPTLAVLSGITMPTADGRVLRSAIVSPPAAQSTRP